MPPLCSFTVERRLLTAVADKQCAGLQTLEMWEHYPPAVPFLNGRESQCSDRFHKPVLVGATPTPATYFKRSVSSFSKSTRLSSGRRREQSPHGPPFC